MKYLIIIGTILFLLVGCTPNPRYRTGGTLTEEPSRRNEKPQRRHDPDRFVKVSTVDLLDLGQIMQGYLGRPPAGEGNGLDCSRFTREVFKLFNGTDLPRTAEQQYALGSKIPRERLRFGDLIYFRTEGRVVSHVGIYVGFDEFIHSSSSTGIIISSMDDKYWKKRFAGGRRILE